MQCSAVKCSTTYHYTIQFAAVQYSAVQNSATQHDGIVHCSVGSVLQHHNAGTKRLTISQSVGQSEGTDTTAHCTVQYGTVKYSTEEHQILFKKR